MLSRQGPNIGLVALDQGWPQTTVEIESPFFYFEKELDKQKPRLESL